MYWHLTTRVVDEALLAGLCRLYPLELLLLLLQYYLLDDLYFDGAVVKMTMNFEFHHVVPK